MTTSNFLFEKWPCNSLILISRIYSLKYWRFTLGRKDISKDQCFFAEGICWEARILNIFQEELSIPGGFTTINKDRLHIRRHFSSWKIKMYRDGWKIFLFYRLTRSVVNIGCSYVIEYLWCTSEKFKLVYFFSCPSSVKYCSSNSSIPGVILHSIMKSIKTPNHPAYHWSTLWPLEVWVRGLYNSWWFWVHKLSMFIYLSMDKPSQNVFKFINYPSRKR